MEKTSGKGFGMEYGTLLLFLAAIASTVLSVMFFRDSNKIIGEVFLVIAILTWIGFIGCVGVISVKISTKSKSVRKGTHRHSSSRTSQTTYLQPDLRAKKKYSKKSKVIISSLKTEISDDECTGEFCSICKLLIRKDQEISICPYCESIFHKEHLSDWLELADDCPVCNRKLREVVHR